MTTDDVRLRTPIREVRKVSPFPYPHELTRVNPWTGCPLWIQTLEGAHWYKCTTTIRVGSKLVNGAGRTAPWRLPQLVTANEGPRHHVARVPRIEYVAWARDVAGRTQPQVARLLYDTDGRYHVTDSDIQGIRRAERDGRNRYHSLGVLPWAAFTLEEMNDENGRERLAPDRWLHDRAFTDAMRRWQLDSIATPSAEPQPDPERARREYFRRITAPALRSLNVYLDLNIGLSQLWAAILRTVPVVAIDREHVLRSHGVEPWDLERKRRRPTGGDA